MHHSKGKGESRTGRNGKSLANGNGKSGKSNERGRDGKDEGGTGISEITLETTESGNQSLDDVRSALRV